MEKDLNLQLRGIKASNFKGIETINVQLSSGQTQIIGLNGSGKTRLVDAIQACCVGVSIHGSNDELVGERFRFIGSKGKGSNFEARFEDTESDFVAIVINKMTVTGNSIKIVTSDGTELTKEWLREFFNASLLSADNFIAHTPKQQTLLLGIKTTKYDANILQIKKVASEYRSEIKAIGTCEDLPETKRVSLSDLSMQKDEIVEFNKEQNDRREGIESHNEQIIKLKGEIEKLNLILKTVESDLKDVPQPLPIKAAELNEIAVKIAAADDINSRAEAYEADQRKREKLDKAEAELTKTQADIEKQNTARTDYIKGFKFPLKGLSVDEDGGLLLNGIRIKDHSKGEREIIVANLRSSLNPRFKTAVIDEFQCLDPANKKKIVDGLIKKGFNVLTLEVGDKRQGDGSILLENCSIADGEKEEDNRPAAL